MAGNVIDMKKSTVGAEETLWFLEVPTDLQTPETKAFHLAFMRMEESSEESNVETEVIADVTQKIQPTEVKSMSPTLPFSGPFLKDDPVCKYLSHIYHKRLVGGAVHANMLKVMTYDKNKAYKYDISIAVSGFPNAAGDLLNVTGTYSITSDGEEGTATIDKTTGIATFTAKDSE